MNSVCRSCGKPIIWCKTENGKIMPVDAEPVDPTKVDGGGSGSGGYGSGGYGEAEIAP